MNPTRIYHDTKGIHILPDPGRQKTSIMKKLSAIKKIISDHKAFLSDRYKICQIGVFGSFVRGDTHHGSDVDVLVEFSEPISLIQLISLENYLTGIVGVKVDVVPKEDIRKELRDEILGSCVYV